MPFRWSAQSLLSVMFTEICMVGAAVVGAAVAGLLQALHSPGHTTLTNDEAQRPDRRPQLPVSKVLQSNVGKSLGLAEGGRREGGTSVEFEVPPIREVMMELTSSLHML